MRRVVLLGFTGAIASGKTTLSQHVRKYGTPVINAGDLGHAAHAPGTPSPIVERSGISVVQQPMMVQQGGHRCSSCNMTLPRGTSFNR